MQTLVLASGSVWRRAMLEDAGIRVEAVEPNVDEASIVGDGPVDTAKRRAEAKAAVVRAARPDAWVLAADQVVHDGAEVFGKPDDPQDHRARLQGMRGRAHDLHTAWVLVGPGEPAHGVCRTRMVVRGDLDDAEIDAYVACGEGSGCAGGYAAERRGAFLFERIEGDFFNVLGLPLLDVMGAMRRRGWRAS